MRDGNKIARAMPGFGLGVSSNGSDFALLTFVVAEGPEAGETLPWYGYFTEKTADRTIESLRHCGWAGADVTDLSGIDRNLVQLVVENETYEGKTRAKIQFVNRLGGGIKPEQQMDDQARKAFAARMKGAAMACPASVASEGTAYVPPKTSEGSSDPGGYGGDPGPGDDDIPF